MVKQELEGQLINAQIVESRSFKIAEKRRMTAHSGQISLDIKLDNGEIENGKMPIFYFENPFVGAALGRLTGQRVRYSQSECDSDGVSDFSLTVLSGSLKGLEYKTNDYIN